MENYPILYTDRLRLDKLRWTDIPKIVEYVSDKDISSTTTNIPHPYHESDAVCFLNYAYEGYANGSQYVFAIRTKLRNNAYIGNIGLHVEKRFDIAEMGYWIAKPYWGNGYATEAAAGLLQFGFEKLQLNKIFARHFSQNPASGKVMIKNGMIEEGILVNHIKKNNRYIDLVQYRLTLKEYLTCH